MLSGTGIRSAVQQGQMIIEPFIEAQLGPCSYDLTMESIWRLRHPELDLERYGMEKFIEKCCVPYDGVLSGGQFYIGKSREKLASVLHSDITTRSSIARLGICLVPLEYHCSPELGPPVHVYFGIYTFGTKCEIPLGLRMAQVSAGKMLPEKREKLEQLVREGSIKPEMRIFHPPGMYPMFLMNAGTTLKEYNGKVLVCSRNNDDCFDERDITNPREIPPRRLVLCSTAQYLEMPADYAGMFKKLPSDFGFGHTDPNSRIAAQGSKGNQVLEMFYPQGRSIQAGQPICGLEIMAIEQPGDIYDGKYSGQRGPQGSLLRNEL